MTEKNTSTMLLPGMQSEVDGINFSRFEQGSVLFFVASALSVIFWARRRNSVDGKKNKEDDAGKTILVTLQEELDERIDSERQARKSERDAWRAASDSLARIATLEAQEKYQAEEIIRLKSEGAELRLEVTTMRREMWTMKRTIADSGIGAQGK